MSNDTGNPIIQQEEEESIDIWRILRRFRRFWYMFLIFPIITAALAWFYLRYQIPVYEVKSTIIIKDDKNKQGISATDLISKEFGLGDNKKMLVDESKIMTSYSVMEEVVRDLKLDRTVMARGRINTSEMYGADLPILIDSFSLKDTLKNFKASLDIVDENNFELTTADGNKQACAFGKTFSNKYGIFLINKNFAKDSAAIKEFENFTIICKGTEKATRDIIKSINIVLPKKESNILEPTMKTAVPAKAKDILRNMVAVYNEHNLSDKNEVSQNTLRFIERRLLSLTGELSGVEQNVEKYKTREGITANAASDIEYLFKNLGEYDGELLKLEVQNSILSSIEDILKKSDASFELLPTNLDLKSSALQSQIGDYNKLVLERNRLLKVAGDNNPNLTTLTEDLKNIRIAIIENISRVKQDNNTLLAQTKSKNTQFTNKLGSTPRKERELTEIKRQQNIKEGLYLFLLQKQEETAISMVGAVADARVVDRPITGEDPISTDKSTVYLVAIFAGLLLGVAYVVVHGFIVNTVQSEDDITSQTAMPILAKIPFSKIQDNLVIQVGSRSAISEMFRLLRTNLQFFLPQNNHQTKGQAILITSTVSGEGKSFITLNLGMSLAIADKKTAIIGLDLRRPKLSDYLGLSRDTVGVTSYLISDMKPTDIIRPSEKHKDLFFIPSGPVPPNPAELIMHPKMGELFAYLKDNFDYIVIDTSPVGLVTDALLLKPHIDMTLFVVRFAYSKRAQLNIIDDLYKEQKLTKPTVILNGIKWDDKSGYGYGYGYGYYAEDPKKAKTKTKVK